MSLKEDIGVAFSIFRRDARRLLTNPLALIIVIGVCFMPSLYAWTTILANWNPYGNSGALKVAVANEDRGATNELVGSVDVGKEVVDELRQNHQLGWQFVSQDNAIEGVEAGTYYAAIVIPQTFSRDFLSVLSGQATRPQLDYYVNEKVSAVAPEFTTTGANTIEEAINENFVQAVSKTVVELAQRTGGEVKTGAETADTSLTEGVSHACEVIGTARQAIADLSGSYESAQSSITTAKEGLTGAETNLPGISTTIEDAKSRLQQLRDELRSFGTQVNGSLATTSFELGRAAGEASGAQAKAQAVASKAESSVATALSTASYLVQENESVLNDLRAQAQADNLGELQDIIGRLEGQNAELSSTLGTLQELNDSLTAIVGELDAAAQTTNDAAEQTASQTQNAATTLQQETLPAITQSLDDFSGALGSLQGTLLALDPALKNTVSALDLLSVTLNQAQVATSAADSSLATIEQDLTNALANLQAIASSTTMEQLSTYLGLDPLEVGTFMASPVKLETVVEYPVRNYGSGVTPFYTNLALWVSGFILTAVLRVQVDEEGLPHHSTTQAYLGRWLLFMVLGLIQGAIVCAGDLALGIQCESPLAFMLAGLLTVVVDVNILYALVFTMRHLGRALGVVLIIVQIPGSSGEYPVEMMPEFFQAIHPYLPFTYSIQAMREAIGGFYDSQYILGLLGLLPFIALALAVGLGAGRYAYNLNALFDDELMATDLFIAEEPNAAHERFRLRYVLKALLDSNDYRQRTIEKVHRFQKRFPQLLRAGWIAIGCLPVLTLALGFAASADTNVKVILLALMVLGIVVVTIYLIVVEFAEQSLQNQLELSRLDAKTVRGHLANAQGQLTTMQESLLTAQETSNIPLDSGTNLLGALTTQEISHLGTTNDLSGDPDRLASSRRRGKPRHKLTIMLRRATKRLTPPRTPQAPEIGSSRAPAKHRARISQPQRVKRKRPGASKPPAHAKHFGKPSSPPSSSPSPSPQRSAKRSKRGGGHA